MFCSICNFHLLNKLTVWNISSSFPYRHYAKGLLRPHPWWKSCPTTVGEKHIIHVPRPAKWGEERVLRHVSSVSVPCLIKPDHVDGFTTRWPWTLSHDLAQPVWHNGLTIIFNIKYFWLPLDYPQLLSCSILCVLYTECILVLC